MSKLFKRLGKKSVKYQFEMCIHRMDLVLEHGGPLCVKWSRGPRSAQTTFISPESLQQVGEHAYQWNVPPLTILSTLYEKKKGFQSKLSRIVVKTRESNTGHHVVIEQIGSADLDLAKCVDFKTSGLTFTVPLLNCADKNASLTISIKVTPVRGSAPKYEERDTENDPDSFLSNIDDSIQFAQDDDIDKFEVVKKTRNHSCRLCYVAS